MLIGARQAFVVLCARVSSCFVNAYPSSAARLLAASDALALGARAKLCYMNCELSGIKACHADV